MVRDDTDSGEDRPADMDDEDIELGDVEIPGTAVDSSPGDFNVDSSNTETGGFTRNGDSSDDVDAVGDREETTAVDTSNLSESDGDGIDLDTPTDPVKCPVCEQEFKSDKGMRIHVGQMHKGAELDDDGELVTDDDGDDGDSDIGPGTSVIDPDDAPDDVTTPDDDNGESVESRSEKREESRKTVEDKWDDAREKYLEPGRTGTIHGDGTRLLTRSKLSKRRRRI